MGSVVSAITRSGRRNRPVEAAGPTEENRMRAFTTLGITFGIMVTFGICVTTTAASAQERRGTAEQQAACTPDVFRLCSSEIPNTDRIVVCLQQNTPQLSRGCRAVFESENQANAAPQARPQRTVRAGAARVDRSPPPPVRWRELDGD
jgi:hypothetical protein